MAASINAGLEANRWRMPPEPSDRGVHRGCRCPHFAIGDWLHVSPQADDLYVRGFRSLELNHLVGALRSEEPPAAWIMCAHRSVPAHVETEEKEASLRPASISENPRPLEELTGGRSDVIGRYWLMDEEAGDSEYLR